MGRISQLLPANLWQRVARVLAKLSKSEKGYCISDEVYVVFNTWFYVVLITYVKKGFVGEK